MRMTLPSQVSAADTEVYTGITIAGLVRAGLKRFFPVFRRRPFRPAIGPRKRLSRAVDNRAGIAGLGWEAKVHQQHHDQYRRRRQEQQAMVSSSGVKQGRI
jgi:hypothetical protein